jgi:hypothetical protein
MLPLVTDKKSEEYIRPFNTKTIPMDAPIAPYARDNLENAKTARAQLLKLAGIRGLSGGVAAQLLSPLASSTNPSALRAPSRKRPASGKSSSYVQSELARKDAQAAQKAATDPSLALYTHSRRHGCTTDVRDMFMKTRDLLPRGEEDLHKMMVEHKLLEPGEAVRRPRLVREKDVDNDGKPKKRRYYVPKNQRMTNTHLKGTEIGNAIEEAMELLRQGKAVGDGGM